MEPLSLLKRRVYFYILSVIFLIAIPVVILYTSGYRLGPKFTLVETGGMYIYSPEAGSSIYIDSKKERETGTFQKDWFVQDVSPGTYTVLIVKDGFWPWMKEVTVEERKVAEAIAFLVSTKPEMEIIPEILEEWDGKATTTEPNIAYIEARALFLEKKEVVDNGKKENVALSATTTDENTDEKFIPEKISSHGRVGLIHEENRIIAHWLKRPEDLPNYFCRNGVCASPVLAFSSVMPIRSFDFYPGRDDVMLIAAQDILFAVEIDTRKIQNFQPIYKGTNPDFRWSNRGLIVKDGETIFRLSL